MVKPRVAMVADDFTGANDASGCFAQAGFSAWAACGDAPAPSAADVEAINCQSRFYNRDEARKRSSAAWRKQAQRGLAGRWLFQKID